MPDREKVIMGAKICEPSKYKRDCNECPYGEEMNCDYVLYHDVITMLTEQEPVKPAVVGKDPLKHCPVCNKRLYPDDNFCSQCGRKMDWKCQIKLNP